MIPERSGTFSQTVGREDVAADRVQSMFRFKPELWAAKFGFGVAIPNEAVAAKLRADAGNGHHSIALSFVTCFWRRCSQSRCPGF